MQTALDMTVTEWIGKQTWQRGTDKNMNHVGGLAQMEVMTYICGIKMDSI
jgi:hypothetical protein